MNRLTAARLGWLAALLALAPSAAHAHFVWAEADPASGGAVRLFFGEYPATREGAPLLDRIAGTRVYAVDAAGRRELTASRRDDHLRYEGMDRAPVAAGLLEYGVVRRGETPPFLLRYQAQLLLGEGKPLSGPELARLSRLRTGLPLSVTLDPAAAGRVGLRVTLDGRPAPAEVAHRGPKDTELKAKPTSPEGALELPLADGGWHHLRVRVDQPGAVTFQGQEAASTRTYLSLMFQVAAPAGESAAPAVSPDPEAVTRLRDAHAARAVWRPDFPGFTADALLRLNGKEARGTVTVRADYTLQISLGDRALENAVRPSLASLVMHRRPGETPDYQASWRDAEPHALGRAINLNDELASFYRVRDRQILQVNRVMGSQRFTNNVMENEQTKLGFLPRAWSVAFYDRETDRLVRSSTTRVTWSWIGDVFVPATLETTAAYDGGTDFSVLTLTNHRLLR